MGFVKTFLLKIGRLLLSLIRVLRRAMCCRRKRQESEMLLPLTINQADLAVSKEPSDLLDWESWNENNQCNASGGLESRIPGNGEIVGRKNSSKSNHDDEDFFKDMVPQFRKPKKLILKEREEETNQSTSGPSSRLAMDPRAILLPGPELGLIDDNPTNWEESESLEELWDSDNLIKEKKLAEREKRIAEHQRRKLEKENRRASKQDVSLSNVLSLHLSETKDKTKYS